LNASGKAMSGMWSQGTALELDLTKVR